MTAKRKKDEEDVLDETESSFWNYRLIRYPGNCLRLAEVYWRRNDRGVPEIFMVNDRPSIKGTSLEAVQEVLKCIGRDIKHEIIDEKNIPNDEDLSAELVEENLGGNNTQDVSTEKQPEQASPTTWETMVKLEPRLGALLEEIKNCQDLKIAKSFCANSIWSKKFKQKMMQLVGWEAKNADLYLCTHQAYDVAYNVLYGALPPCRNCGCL